MNHAHSEIIIDSQQTSEIWRLKDNNRKKKKLKKAKDSKQKFKKKSES